MAELRNVNGNGNGNGHTDHLCDMINGQQDNNDEREQQNKPFKPQWPLTSWADTKQNTACIAFLLGCIFTIGINNGRFLLTSIVASQESYKLSGLPTTSERFWNAVTSPRLGLYIALLVIFHMLEFLTTAIWNPTKVTNRSFLLEDRNHNAAHLFAFCEYILEETFLPKGLLTYKRSPYLLVIGLVVTIAAQYLRSLAMITAATNFSHLIVYDKAPEHSLVRTGIYGWSRHPSYVAFFYWALGTQIFIGNPLAFVAFSIVLYRFFSHRIKVEEWYLVKFFGQDYVKYQQEVSARIPFIR